MFSYVCSYGQEWTDALVMNRITRETAICAIVYTYYPVRSAFSEKKTNLYCPETIFLKSERVDQKLLKERTTKIWKSAMQ